MASSLRSLVTTPMVSRRSSRVATVAYDHCRPAERRVSRTSRTVAWPRSHRTFKTSSSESGIVGGRLAIGRHLKEGRNTHPVARLLGVSAGPRLKESSDQSPILRQLSHRVNSLPTQASRPVHDMVGSV